MSACTCPHCVQPGTDTPEPDVETTHEPVHLPDVPREFRVHYPDGHTQDCTLHPDGAMTMAAGGQLWRSGFTFDEMRERNWEHAHIEWDPPPAEEPKAAEEAPAVEESELFTASP